LLAEFADPASLIAAMRSVRAARFRIADAFTPFPLDEVVQTIAPERPLIRPVMLAAGVLVAALAYVVQWYSAVIDYPIDSGGRPLHSWPVFLLVPFEVGVFVAAVAGLLAFLWECGLPRLHDSVFGVPGFERATDDRFLLLAEAPGAPDEGVRLRHILADAGALVVTEMRER
jgi:hypothetical protein